MMGESSLNKSLENNAALTTGATNKIGFVGLGTMGFPMAVNLKKAGFEVIGYDAFKGVYEKASAAGITMVETLKEVAEQADEAISQWFVTMPKMLTLFLARTRSYLPNLKIKQLLL